MGKALLLFLGGCLIWLGVYSYHRRNADRSDDYDVANTFPTPYSQVFDVCGVRLGMSHAQIGRLLKPGEAPPLLVSEGSGNRVTSCSYPGVPGKISAAKVVFVDDMASSVEASYDGASVVECGGVEALLNRMRSRLGNHAERLEKGGQEIFIWTHLKKYHFVVAFAKQSQGGVNILYCDDRITTFTDAKPQPVRSAPAEPGF